MVAGLLVLVAVLWAKLDDWIPNSWSVQNQTVSYEVKWKEWSPGLVELHRERGQMVFLVFTSDWDITHLINKERIYSNQEVLKKLAKHQVVLIKADYTNQSPAIRKELQRYGRNYLPTTVVAPADPNAPVIVMPEVFGPKEALQALEQAAAASK